MKTRDILETVYGTGSADSFSTRLADIGSSLVQAAEDREAHRMAAAEVRDEMAYYGPLIDQVGQALAHQQAQQLTDSRLPAVMAFDAYCVMKDASKANPGDRGLKQAAHALYDRWNQAPMDHLTVGELVTYRDHFIDMFPKSACKHVFDEQIPAVGFNTLTNLPYLTRIASEVVDQESYENAMEAYGLDGDRPEQIRARAYIQGIADLALSNESFTFEPPTLQGASERALERVAQALSMGDEGEEENKDEMPEEAVMTGAEGEEELPHEEETEELATINSPITGEPLVVELGVKEDERAEGMEPGEEDEPAPMAGPLPNAFEPKAQYQEMAPVDMEPAGPGGPMDAMNPPEMGAGGGEHDMAGDMGEQGQETMTTIVDPTSGEELQMTLSPIEDEEPMGEPEDQGGGLKDELDEMGGGSPMEQGGEKSAAKKSERGFDEAMNTNVPTQQGRMTGDHSETDAQNFFSEHSKSPKSKKDNKKKDEKKAQKLSHEQIFKVCASFGLSPDSIEEQLLDGNEIAAGAYALRIGSADEIELRKLAFLDSTKDAKVIRTASLADFDGIVGDFMALTAAQFAQAQAAPKPVQKAAAKTEKTTAYVVTSDVPQGAPINARRMMASIWKLLPNADGELMDNGRLSVYVPSAAERDINRVARVLADVFGVANIESQKLAKSAQIQNQLQQGDSPYRGQTPVARQPAGAPARSLQAPMQQPLTGAGAQQDFIARHTDPLKQAEIDCAGCSMGEPHEKHADLNRQALDDESMGDEMPPEEGEDLANLPVGDPALDGGGGQMGADPMMGGAPPMGGGMPGMGMPMPGMGMPGDPMGGMMGGGAPAPDASQMPIDIGTGQLMPEDDMAVQAAMMHFRNMGMTPLEALDKFTNAYGALFDKYGDKSSPQRSMAEAAVIRAMGQAWAQPSVVPAKKSGAQLGHVCHAEGCTKKVTGKGDYCPAHKKPEDKKPEKKKKADLPHPRPPTQHPGQVTVKKDWNQGNVPQPAQVPTQPGPMQGTYADKGHMDQGDTSSHAFGGDKKPGPPQKGSKHRQTGTDYPSTDITPGTDGSGESELSRKMDRLSKDAPGTVRSASLVIHFDPELGDFHVIKGEKTLSIQASLNEALADAERRAIGADLRILIDDGSGGYEDATTGELVTLL